MHQYVSSSHVYDTYDYELQAHIVCTHTLHFIFSDEFASTATTGLLFHCIITFSI